ncbi:MAG: hypothetical protein HYZ32_01810, partial [Hydrocarboniphaga effusa]|nr:hypothetical protein [Hydrocarboniphaga effusa]
MKHLQILNAVLLATGAVMALVLAVVCLIYSVYLDSEPRLRAEMPLLLTFTALFAALMLAGGLAFFGQHRQWRLRWLLQGLPVLPLTG